MKLIRAIIRPHKVEDVKNALAAINIYAMTLTDVRGCGKQKGHATRYRGAEYVANILPKIQLDLILEDDQIEDVIPVIAEAARTGEVGDGKIFIFECAGSYTIRTGEAGL